jgi:glycosyltransferase involved in cell wall biosynthesis
MDTDIVYSDIIGFPFLNIWACKRSCRKFLNVYLKKHEIDAIVFYNMRLENTPIALYAKKKYGIPIICQYEDGLTQDATVRGLKKCLYRRMERIALPELDGAFLVNSQIAVPCPSVVIRGAIRDADTGRSATGLRPESPPVILFASTLDHQRGVEVLLEALKYTNTEFRLQITGRGEAEDLIRECTDPRVEYLGFLNYDDYVRILRNADICVNAQLAHHEFGNFSFPSKLYEYLSERKLVVSSDVADARAAIGDVAFIYGNDDPKELAAALEEAVGVLYDTERYREYQSRIQRLIQENSIEFVAERVNNLLDSIGAKK